jgi:hypothetical protein
VPRWPMELDSQVIGDASHGVIDSHGAFSGMQSLGLPVRLMSKVPN